MTEPQRSESFFSKLAEDLLVGTVNAFVRAGAKFTESIMGDAEKAIEKQRRKIEATREGVAEWRKRNIGDIKVDDEEEGNR